MPDHPTAELRAPDRVQARTAAQVNRRIREDLIDCVHYYSRHPHLIGERMRDLDREWDVERALEANAATFGLATVALGAVADPRFRWITLAVSGFLLQHALQGWCPPLPVLRRLGFRTTREIEMERLALRLLRGDFDRIGRGTPAGSPERARSVLVAMGIIAN